MSLEDIPVGDRDIVGGERCTRSNKDVVGWSPLKHARTMWPLVGLAQVVTEYHVLAIMTQGPTDGKDGFLVVIRVLQPPLCLPAICLRLA